MFIKTIQLLAVMEWIVRGEVRVCIVIRGCCYKREARIDPLNGMRHMID